MARSQDRRERYEDDDDSRFDEPKRKKGGYGPLLIVGGVIGSIVLLGGLCIGWGFVSNAAKKVKENEMAKNGQVVGVTKGQERKFTREEWKTMLIGKTPEEVIAAVGRPNRTREYTDETPHEWGYYNKVFNPVTAKYETGEVIFHDSKVVEATWN
jgi:hypothetical protein